MASFIYVFTEAERDILIAKGYSLLTCDEHSYVFVNDPELSVECFSLEGINCVETDIIVF